MARDYISFALFIILLGEASASLCFIITDIIDSPFSYAKEAPFRRGPRNEFRRAVYFLTLIIATIQLNVYYTCCKFCWPKAVRGTRRYTKGYRWSSLIISFILSLFWAILVGVSQSNMDALLKEALKLTGSAADEDKADLPMPIGAPFSVNCSDPGFKHLAQGQGRGQTMCTSLKSWSIIYICLFGFWVVALIGSVVIYFRNRPKNSAVVWQAASEPGSYSTTKDNLVPPADA